jgi:hypothetical protein
VRRLWLAWVALLAGLAPAVARAQEFVKVEGAAREELPAGRFVAAAYAFIWIAVLAYVVVLARGLARVRKDADELRGKVEQASRTGGPAPRA